MLEQWYDEKAGKTCLHLSGDVNEITADVLELIQRIHDAIAERNEDLASIFIEALTDLVPLADKSIEERMEYLEKMEKRAEQKRQEQRQRDVKSGKIRDFDFSQIQSIRIKKEGDDE